MSPTHADAARHRYSGIGSRSTPVAVLERMRLLASELAAMGYELRSGGADGADMAFEEGCEAGRGRKSIWLPWAGFQGRYPAAEASTYLPTEEAFRLASAVHPAWHRLGRGPRSLHARNVHQLLGTNLAEPSAFVVCWTADGAENAQEVGVQTGGTGTVIRMASAHHVPVFNLGQTTAEARLRRYFSSRTLG